MYALGLESRNYMSSKKGDMKKVTNYRGISLLGITFKVLSIVILKRLEIYAVNIVGETESTGIRYHQS